MEVVVRAATPGDAAAIAGVHVRAWQSAYRGMIDDEILDGLSVAQRAGDWTARLRPSQSRAQFTLVAERDGAVLGFCSVTRPEVDAEVTIRALYLEPGHLRGGIGGALLGAALRRLGDAGLDDVVLWVLEANRGARSFYARFGFVEDGGRERLAGAPEIRMRTSLPSSGTLFAHPTQEL